MRLVIREYTEELSEEVKIYNLLDDYLAIHPNEVGEFTKNNKDRLYNDLVNAELTGADLIVVTCSTLTPFVEQFRQHLSVPVIAIDDAMGKKAVTLAAVYLFLPRQKARLSLP